MQHSHINGSYNTSKECIVYRSFVLESRHTPLQITRNYSSCAYNTRT